MKDCLYGENKYKYKYNLLRLNSSGYHLEENNFFTNKLGNFDSKEF